MSTAKPEQAVDLPPWNEGKTPSGWRQLRAFETVRAGDIYRRDPDRWNSGRWEPAYNPGPSAGCDQYFRRIPATVAEALKTDYRELVPGELTAKGDLWRIGASTRRQASDAEIAAAALEVAPFGGSQGYEPQHFHSYGRYRLLPQHRDGVIPEGFVRVELGGLLRAGDLCSAGPVWRSIGSMFVGNTVHLEIFIRPIVAASASTAPKVEETAPTEVAKPAKTATEEQDEAIEAANDKFTDALTAARAAFEQLDALVQLPPDEPVDVRVLGPDKNRVTLTLDNDQLDTFHAAVRLIGGKRTNGWVTPLCDALRDLPRYRARKGLWGDLLDWQDRQNVSGSLAFHE